MNMKKSLNIVHVHAHMLSSMIVLVSKFDIYVCITITGSIPLLLDY